MTSVILEYKCGCDKQQWYKIRFYKNRLTDTGFDKLPPYIGVADLVVKGDEAHVSGFIMSGYDKFRRMHDNDLEQQIRINFPQARVILWERHKDSEVIKFMRQLN